jgi:hypothetical protein
MVQDRCGGEKLTKKRSEFSRGRTLTIMFARAFQAGTKVHKCQVHKCHWLHVCRLVYGGWLADKINGVPDFKWNLFGLKFKTDANGILVHACSYRAGGGGNHARVNCLEVIGAQLTRFPVPMWVGIARRWG